MRFALCKDYDLGHMLPGKKGKVVTAQARAVCGRCPARPGCLKFVLTHYNEARDPGGIWAGTTPAERRVLRRRASNAPSTDPTPTDCP